MVNNDFLERVIWEKIYANWKLFKMKNMQIFSLKNDAVTKCLKNHVQLVIFLSTRLECNLHQNFSFTQNYH